MHEDTWNNISDTSEFRLRNKIISRLLHTRIDYSVFSRSMFPRPSLTQWYLYFISCLSLVLQICYKSSFLTAQNNIQRTARGTMIQCENFIWVRMMERAVANTELSWGPCHQSQVTTFTWRLYVITRPLIFTVADLSFRVFKYTSISRLFFSGLLVSFFKINEGVSL